MMPLAGTAKWTRTLAATLVLFGATLMAAPSQPLDEESSSLAPRTVTRAAAKIEKIDGREAVAGEVIVKYRTGQRFTASSYAARTHALRSAGELATGGWTHLRSTQKSTAELMRELSQEADIEYVEPNYILHADATPATVAPNDASFAQQWGLRNTGQTGGTPNADVNATAAWSIATGSTSVVAGIVDTGIQYTHPDLSANMWSAPTSFTVVFGPNDNLTCPAGSHGYDALTNSCDPMDQNGHGTHVAGIVGAKGNNGAGVSGVNWTTAMMGLRFMDATGTGTVAGAVRAIRFAILAKAAMPNAANVRVLNASWGGYSSSQALLDAINAASTAGILVVASAGNSGLNLDTNFTYPASYRTPNLIAVGASDANDTLAAFSNYGYHTVDVAAPGVGIYSTYLGSAYSTLSGTSMAAPYVTGSAALVAATCTKLDTVALRTTLLTNADTITGLNGVKVAWGRLNLYKALRSCAPVAPVVPPATPPGFTLTTGSTNLTLVKGGAATSTTLTVNGAAGFTGQVSFSVQGLPGGVTLAFAPTAVASGGTTTMKLTPLTTVVVGSYPITVIATSGKVTVTQQMSLVINVAPSFTLTATPATQTVTAGQAISFTIAAVPVGGFAGGVSMTISGIPTYTAAAFVLNPNGSVTITLTTTTRTPKLTNRIVMIGSATIAGVVVKQTATVTLTVQ